MNNHFPPNLAMLDKLKTMDEVYTLRLGFDVFYLFPNPRLSYVSIKVRGRVVGRCK